MWQVVVTPTAVRERERIDSITRKRVDAVLRLLRSEPRSPGAKKLVGSRSNWRLRVGDYRVLFEIDDEAQRVTVWRIAHRRDAYR